MYIHGKIMNAETDKIKLIYNGKVGLRYDVSMSHFFDRFKRKAFNDSSLKPGDQVLVFCCGTGMDFPHILRKIGNKGKIIGVDFSSEMLKQAKNKLDRNHWNNIDLVEADVTKFEYPASGELDAGVCTLGMSIIPEYRKAYENLMNSVKPSGEVVIGDMQLASGWHARFNPLTLFLSRKYGGTYEGHQNSLELQELMKRDLVNLKKREFFFNSYFYCIGQKMESVMP